MPNCEGKTMEVAPVPPGSGGSIPTPSLHYRPRAELLTGAARDAAISAIRANHYTRSVPSGESHYIAYETAIVVWSIPANAYLSRFLTGGRGRVWELSRLWAPDGHRPNLLTEAISAAVHVLRCIENPDVLVSYADPNAGHSGGVYRAASWAFHGRSTETRVYVGPDGLRVARRAFHSGSRSLTKPEIEARGYKEVRLPGKLRFVRPLTRLGKRELLA